LARPRQVHLPAFHRDSRHSGQSGSDLPAAFPCGRIPPLVK
jgi:hypothetical protein